MKDNQSKIKMSLWKFVLFLILVSVLLIYMVLGLKNSAKMEIPNRISEYNNYFIENYEDKEYYISNGDYKGDYDLQTLYLGKKNVEDFTVSTLMSYSKYQSFCKKWDLEQKYHSNKQRYIVFSSGEKGCAGVSAILSGVEIKENMATLYIWDKVYSAALMDAHGYVIIVPITENVTHVEMQSLYTKDEYKELTGKEPSVGYDYTNSDNQKMAEACYFETDNENLNLIINNMLDEMVKQHTIKIETEHAAGYDSPTTTYFDLTTSIEKFICGGEVLAYSSYRDGIHNEALGCLFRECDYDMLEHPDAYNIAVNEDEDNYIITGELLPDMNDEGTETYYINKTTNLLEKVIIKMTYYEPTSEISYTNDVIEVQDDLSEEVKAFNSKGLEPN